MMSATRGNRLPKRLTRKEEFRRIIRSGKRFRQAFLQISVHPVQKRDGDEKVDRTGRVGFVIPEKAVRGAVKRNRIRRLLRECIRHWWTDISPEYDVVLTVKDLPGQNHAAFVEGVFLRLLLKAGLLTDEGRASAEASLAGLSGEYEGTGRGKGE